VGLESLRSVSRFRQSRFATACASPVSKTLQGPDNVFRLAAGHEHCSETLPCDGGTARDPGNLSLLNLNGDASVNMVDAIYLTRYLFLAGPPPLLGDECIRIVGCPDVCAP